MQKLVTLLFLAAALACVQHPPAGYPIPPKDYTVKNIYPGGATEQDSLAILKNLDDPRTKKFGLAQSALTEDSLTAIPFRGAVINRVAHLAKFERYLNAQFHNGWIYFRHNPGASHKQPLLFRTRSISAEPELVFDPISLDTAGSVSLGEFSFSPDGKFIALALSFNGSDWRTIRVLDLSSRQLYSDEVVDVKFTDEPAWKGSEGFFYNRFPTPENEFSKSLWAKVWFHRLGTSQSEDELVFENRSDSLMLFAPKVKADRFLVIEGSRSTSNNSLFVKDLNQTDAQWVAIRPDATRFEYETIGAIGDNLFVRTNEKAPMSRLVKVNLNRPEKFIEILPDNPKKVLAGVWLAGGKIVAHYQQDAISNLEAFDLDGRHVGKITLPKHWSTVTEFNGEFSENRALFSLETFLHPASIWQLDLSNWQVSAFREVDSPLTADDYETRQIWVTSKDGTRLPAFVVCKKGTPMNGKNPTLLYGYGGFNISVTPRFRLLHAAFLDAGGVLVVASLRGGREYGDDWHWAGTKTKKQNVFDDFIAFARHLIAEKYTSPRQLAIQGGSNGGLLVAACMIQAPELFAVVLPQVGVMNMLQFATVSGGQLWESDYGSVENEAEFKALRAYSPVHNVSPGIYPATLLMTALTDTRVAPWHSLQLAAVLQANQKGPKPILLRTEKGAGHGPGKTVGQQILETADALAFTFYHMGLTYQR